jgi:redox-sensitive bicupin YhaK (pirin superfamily)
VDIELTASQSLRLPVPSSHNAFIYVFEGTLQSDGKQMSAPMLLHYSVTVIRWKCPPALMAVDFC